MPVQLLYVQSIMNTTNAADLSSSIFTILIHSGDQKYSSHYGITLNRYFKHILPAGVVAQWLAARTAGCTIPVRISSRLKYFLLVFFNFFELILRSVEIGW